MYHTVLLRLITSKLTGLKNIGFVLPWFISVTRRCRTSNFLSSLWMAAYITWQKREDNVVRIAKETTYYFKNNRNTWYPLSSPYRIKSYWERMEIWSQLSSRLHHHLHRHNYMESHLKRRRGPLWRRFSVTGSTAGTLSRCAFFLTNPWQACVNWVQVPDITYFLMILCYMIEFQDHNHHITAQILSFLLFFVYREQKIRD